MGPGIGVDPAEGINLAGWMLIIGGVVGLLILVAVVVLIFVLVNKRKRRQQQAPMPQFYPSQQPTQGGAVDVVVPSLQAKPQGYPPATNAQYWPAGPVPGAPMPPAPPAPQNQAPQAAPAYGGPPTMPVQQPYPPQPPVNPPAPTQHSPHPEPLHRPVPAVHTPEPEPALESKAPIAAVESQSAERSDSNPWAPPGHTGQPVSREPQGGVISEISLPPSQEVPAPVEEVEAERTVLSSRRRGPQWQLTLPNGEQLPITADQVVLGRRPDANQQYPEAQLVAIADEGKTVSKNHAVLLLSGDQWQIVDLDSTNGVVLIAPDGAETLLPVGGSGGIQRDFLLGEAKLSLVVGVV